MADQNHCWSGGVPYFVIEKIVGFLPFDDALNARLTCRSWSDAVMATIQPFVVDLEITFDNDIHSEPEHIVAELLGVEDDGDEDCEDSSLFCRINVDYLFVKHSGFVCSYLARGGVTEGDEDGNCKWPSFVRVREIVFDLNSTSASGSMLQKKAFAELTEWFEQLSSKGHFDSIYSLLITSMNVSKISESEFNRFLDIFKEVRVFNLHDLIGLHADCVFPFMGRLMQKQCCERIDFIGCFIDDENAEDLFSPLQTPGDVPQRRLSLDFSDSPSTAVSTEKVIEFVENWIESDSPLVFESIRFQLHPDERQFDLSRFCRLHCSLCRWRDDPESQNHIHSFSHLKFKSLYINVDNDTSSIIISCFMKACSKLLKFTHDGMGNFKISSSGRIALHARTISRHDALVASINKKRSFINNNEVEINMRWNQVPSTIPFIKPAIISVEFEWIELPPGLEGLFHWDWFASRSYHLNSLPHRRDWKSFMIEVEPNATEPALSLASLNI